MPSRQSGFLSQLFQCSDSTFLIAVCAVSIVLRIPLLLIDVVPTSDFGWYFGRAREIAEGGGYAQNGVPTAFWPVGWPGFLGGLMRVAGVHVAVGQIANLVLSTFVVCLVVAIGRRLSTDPRIGRLAALTIVLLPNQIAYVPLLSVEIFFECLLLLGFFLLMSQSKPRLIAAGLVFGIAALTKSQALLLPFVLGLPLLTLHLSWLNFRRYLRTVVLAGIPMIVLILPWTVRNYILLDAFVPVSTNGGITLLTGNNPSAHGGYTPDDPLVKDISVKPADQIQADRLAKDRAVRWIEEHPMAFTELIPLKIWGLWAGDGEAEWLYQSGFSGYDRYVVAFRIVRILNQLLYWAVLGLAAIAAWPMFRQRRLLSPWWYAGWALIGYFTAISVVFSGQSRFHFALMPFIAIYAAWTVVSRPQSQPILS